jgi:hypothetical protein
MVLGVVLATVAVLRNRSASPHPVEGTVVNATPVHDAPSALAVTAPSSADAGAVAPLVVVTDLPHEKGAPHHAGHPTGTKVTPPGAASLPPIATPPTQAALVSPPPAPEPKPVPPAPKASANVMDPGY